MESHGHGGIIQITRATYELIRNDFICEPQGIVNVKGKGEMEVWYVRGLLNKSPEHWYVAPDQDGSQDSIQ